MMRWLFLVTSSLAVALGCGETEPGSGTSTENSTRIPQSTAGGGGTESPVTGNPSGSDPRNGPSSGGSSGEANESSPSSSSSTGNGGAQPTGTGGAVNPGPDDTPGPSAGGTTGGRGGSSPTAGSDTAGRGGSPEGGASPIGSSGQGGALGDGGSNAQGGQGGTPVLTGTPTHEERATLQTVRQEHSAGALNGEVYVIGGFTPQVTASVQAYDPNADSWRDVADFPEALHHGNVAVVADRLYVLGFNRDGGFTDVDGRTFAYDPATNEWTERATMPVGTERASACTAALGSKIYLFGGSKNTNGNSTTEIESSVYDTELDEWQALPPMPEPREHCVAAGLDGMLYVVSGRSGGISGLEVESWAFDPVANLFSERAAIPTPRGGTAGAVLGGRIFVFGGEGNPDDPNQVFHNVEAYDPSSDSWEVLPDMLIARHGFAAAAVGERIYLPGGATNQGFGPDDSHTVFFFE